MTNSENASSLVFENVCFSYDKNHHKPQKKAQTVKNFSLEAVKGGFTTLLGPSGCGKTTLLRLVSGFLEPTSGAIKIDGIDQKNIPPEERKIGMVFQDYALFPHLTVQKNLLYGLELKKGSRKNRESNIEEVRKTAEILGIDSLLEKFPHQLSGGQQQRVALGRALVLKPKILLMDEPLSSLDAKLRTQVREELQEIQKELGITTVYVTHDQEEALSMSDKIAVINEGILLQTGSPHEVYFKPADKFVADFVGRANFFEISDETFMVHPEWITVQKKENSLQSENLPAQKNDDALSEILFNGSETEGKVISSSFLGANVRIKIQTKIESCSVIVADIPSSENEIFCGESVTLKITKCLKL